MSGRSPRAVRQLHRCRIQNHESAHLRMANMYPLVYRHSFTLVPEFPGGRFPHIFTPAPKDTEALSEVVRAQLELVTGDEV